MTMQHLTQLIMLISLTVFLQLLFRPASMMFSAILLGMLGLFGGIMLFITVFIR